jgi:hypothetical protein
MRVATLMLSKDIHWLISPSDPPLVPLKQLSGWSVLHPLTALMPTEPIRTFPVGDGRLIVSRPVLHCVVPEAEAGGHLGNAGKEGMRLDERFPEHAELNRLLVRLRHVSRQATLPRGDDFCGFCVPEIDELPQFEFGEPYFGTVHFGDESHVETALTMEMVVKAGELPTDFEPPVYEGVLLDAFKAVKDHDFRTALFYSALAIEALAGAIIDEEHQKMLRATLFPPHIRAVESQEGKTKGELEDPVYKYLRRTSRFAELLHELPLYALQKSLKLDMPEVYEQARKLYQTRNSLAHRGEPSKDKDLLPVDLYGAVDALKCATKVFAWFGVSGKWSIPFERGVDEWRRRTGGVGGSSG